MAAAATGATTRPAKGATKGARTRRRIVELAAPVFNQRGYAGASMRAVLEATGLEKGGLYNHFGSKDDLAIEAFDYAVSLVADRFVAARASTDDPVAQLQAIVHAFAAMVREPPVPGGCPIVNTAVESDDTHPALRERARKAMDDWHRLVGAIVKEGKQRGVIDAHTDPYALATLMTASLEGALILSRLFGDTAHMRRTVEHLDRHLESLRRRRRR